jgi:hypothetical protein
MVEIMMKKIAFNEADVVIFAAVDKFLHVIHRLSQ